jgi:hypothetical protein
MANEYVRLDDIVYHLDAIEFDADGKCEWDDIAAALMKIRLCVVTLPLSQEAAGQPNPNTADLGPASMVPTCTSP